METAAYLDSLRADGAKLGAAARAGLSARVPACPDWTVADLVRHVAGVHRWAGAMVRDRATERLSRSEMPQAPEADDELLDWYDECLAQLVDALSNADPDDAMWTFAGEGKVSFWQRRQAQETAVHRWDAQSAHGKPEPIGPELAVDGVDEIFTFAAFMPGARELSPDAERTLHLHATDTEGEWLLRLGPDGVLSVEHGHAKGDAAARGTASDLLLFLWGRVKPTELEIFGDAALIDRWQEHVRI